MKAQKHSELTRRSFIRQGLCAALGTAALTNTIRDLRFINAAMAQGTGISDYKALVCIFLAGGNDSNNLIIPTIPEEYANYAAIRTPALALPNTDGSPATALALNSLSSDGHNYALHPACPELRTLFNTGKLATVFNVGTLVYPVSKSDYNSGGATLPPQLFSHSDQVEQWQTSIADKPPVNGWAGRCADLLDTYNPQNGNTANLSMCISLGGSNTFEVGGVTRQYQMGTDDVATVDNGVLPWQAQTAGATAFNQIMGIGATQQNMLMSNYAMAVEHAIATGSALSGSLGNSPLLASYFNNFPTDVTVPNGGGTIGGSYLMAQMKMVARIIDAGYRNAAQGGLGMKRQIFFVQVGGYDTHTAQTSNSGNTQVNNAQVVTGSHASLLAELSQSIGAFQAAMTKIGQQYGDASFDQRVTAFTSSDFGRTLPSNNLGSDHGWGSHHLVVGGAVKGQRTYGKFPQLVVGGADDTDTGRWIPTTSVDQFAATMAKWFGVDNTHMSTVFPNLGRFSVPDLGFMG